MTKRRKSAPARQAPPPETTPSEAPIVEELHPADAPDLTGESITTRAAVPQELLDEAMMGEGPETAQRPASAENVAALFAVDESEAAASPAASSEANAEGASSEVTSSETGAAPLVEDADDEEQTVNLAGDLIPGRDDLDEPTAVVSGDALGDLDGAMIQRRHLRGLVEALIFASDSPIKPNELGKLAQAPVKQVKELLIELKQEFTGRGIELDEVAGGWVFRTSAQYAPFIRDLTKQKPVRLSRAQVETLAIIAYRQPITRPEVDDVRGVDSGPVLKLLLERDLVRILGKRDEPGRPLIYGTTIQFLEFFGLKSLKDLPTLREFTELTDESRQAYEDEMGEVPNDAPPGDPIVETSRDHHADTQEVPALHEQHHEGHEGHEHHPESMSVPIGEQALTDFNDDLEPVSGLDEPTVALKGRDLRLAGSEHEDDGEDVSSVSEPIGDGDEEGESASASASDGERESGRERVSGIERGRDSERAVASDRDSGSDERGGLANDGEPHVGGGHAGEGLGESQPPAGEAGESEPGAGGGESDPPADEGGGESHPPASGPVGESHPPASGADGAPVSARGKKKKKKRG